MIQVALSCFEFSHAHIFINAEISKVITLVLHIFICTFGRHDAEACTTVARKGWFVKAARRVLRRPWGMGCPPIRPFYNRTLVPAREIPGPTLVRTKVPVTVCAVLHRTILKRFYLSAKTRAHKYLAKVFNLNSGDSNLCSSKPFWSRSNVITQWILSAEDVSLNLRLAIPFESQQFPLLPNSYTHRALLLSKP